MNVLTIDRWTRVWRQVADTADTRPVFEELLSRYSEPHRYYHNLNHIAECLVEFDSARELARDPLAVELAIWFHDAVYDTRGSDNEEKSAELAKWCIEEAGGSSALPQSVIALVVATKTHDSSAHPDAPLLVDVDLSILGQRKERFDQYESQIRHEYDWVAESVFAAKRAQILEGFLARERVYTTQPFFAKYEQAARTNLRDSVRKLRSRA